MARILVIDDEEEVLLAVSRRLKRSGHDVTPAANAQQGIGKIVRSEYPFDVIVTDMSIENPNSGLEVLQAALNRDVLAEVIVMTAYGSVANAVECMRRGAFDYVEKNQPGVDTYEVLAEKVANALERRRRDMRMVGKWQLKSASKLGHLRQ